MVTWCVLLHYTDERCRGLYLSVTAGTEVLGLVGTLLPHIVLVTLLLCVNTHTITKATYRTKMEAKIIPERKSMTILVGSMAAGMALELRSAPQIQSRRS